MTTRLGSLNTFCWMDLKTHDIPSTAAFLSTILGWDFSVDEQDWRRATKVTVKEHQIGTVSDLANPIYPAGTPEHIAFYLAVQDVDRQAEAAALHGAQIVLPPFDAGDQGRVATLLDPEGAAFSLWQPGTSRGWRFPPNTAYAPQCMILACQDPHQAELFYGKVLGTPLQFADFVTAHDPEATTPQWELAIGAPDLDQIATRARATGAKPTSWSNETDQPSLHLRSPNGLAIHVRPLR